MRDNPLDEFDRRLSDRIARHREKQARTSRELFGSSPEGLEPAPDLHGLPFEEAIAAYDDWVDRRIRAWRGESQPQFTKPPRKSSRHARSTHREEPWRRGRMQPVHQLGDMDNLVMDAFALREFMPTCVDELPPMTICRTVEGFAAPLRDYLPGYRTWFPRWVEQVHANRGQVQLGNPISQLAIHLPGIGTYVNGWQLLGEHDDLSEAWQDDKTLRRAVKAVASERWGHGFIERYTAWGEDLHEMNLDALYLIQRLELPPPRNEALFEKSKAMSEGAIITTAGWARWIGEYLARRTRAPGSVPLDDGSQMDLSQFWNALQRLLRVVPLESWAEILGTPVPGLDRLFQGFKETLNWLLLNTDMDFQIVNRCVRRCQRTVTSPKLQDRHELGISLPDRLTQMMFNNVEARLGVMPVPYAVLIAANVSFDPRWSASEIRRWIDGDARQNIDTRLMMLARMDTSVKHNVSTLVSTAVHSLGMRPPEGLEWT